MAQILSNLELSNLPTGQSLPPQLSTRCIAASHHLLAVCATPPSSPIFSSHLPNCSLLQPSIILLPFVPSTVESDPLVPCSHPISSFTFHHLLIVCAFFSRPRSLLSLHSIRFFVQFPTILLVLLSFTSRVRCQFPHLSF